MHPPDFTLQRNAFGQLVLSRDGRDHTGVTVVRAFPIGAPDDGLSLVSPDGHELAWIDHIDQLPPAMRPLISEALASREFMPVIQRIRSVSSFATPSTWSVDTERGATQLVLKGEDDIRRMTAPALLISDSHGIHYLIRDPGLLDKASRKLLDRFL